ncbi:MAG TPA: glycerophosphodiester phosphodiesterase [Candidatus Binataceae bacterium]|nr:glycerophosphodiester phosphodiesterase [Candidatus Binataceae bacterium]
MARSALDSDFFDLPTPRIIAHRGASGEYPENTLVSFRAAAEADAPYFELDVHLTRDRVVVVSHDANLKRTCGLDVEISDLTLAELKRADAGWGFTSATDTAGGGGAGEFPFRGRGIEVPALAEVFAAFPERRYIVEIKQSVPSLTAALLEVIERAGMRRHVLIASEEQAPLDEIRALAPTLPTGFPYHEIAGFMVSLAPGAEPYRPRGDALQIPPEYESWRLVTPQSVAAAHRLGLEVHVWTVNDAAEMRAMLALGVDGIITDYPSRLRALL